MKNSLYKVTILMSLLMFVLRFIPFAARTYDCCFETSAQVLSTTNIESGTFLIKNQSIGKYLTYVGAGSLELRDYNGADNQKWHIRHFESGYVITSLNETTPTIGNHSYCLYHFSNYTVSSVVGSNPDTDIGMCWTITQSSGSFFLQCIRNPNYYLTAYSSSNISLSFPINSGIYWNLIECSNKYILPTIGDSSFCIDKYCTTGTEGLKQRMNCYSYAVGFYGDYSQNYYSSEYSSVQPGYISNRPSPLSSYTTNWVLYPDDINTLTQQSINAWKNWIIDSLNLDLKILCNDPENDSSLRVYSSSLSEVMLGPWKKVALVIDPYYFLYRDENSLPHFRYPDYHWYVETEDGYWTHKLGLEDAMITDFSGSLITDPENCDRGNYSVFCGYYKIKIDCIPEYISPSPYENVDCAGDILKCSQSLGLISHGLLNQPTTFSAKIDYCDEDGLYDIQNTTVVNSFLWKADVDWFEFMVDVSGIYDIYSSGSNACDLYGALYCNNVCLAVDDDSYYGDHFKITAYLDANTLYSLRVSGYSESEDACEYYINFY